MAARWAARASSVLRNWFRRERRIDDGENCSMTAKFKVVDLPPEATCGPALIAQCAAEILPEPVEWLWPGRVAIGKQTLIAGEPGLGKSQIAIAMAAAVTTGGDWPCGEGHAPLGNVIVLQAEDGLADTV